MPTTRPSGVMKAELTKARAIRDGKRHGKMLPVLYEFPRRCSATRTKPWKDPANWPMVTPNLGRSSRSQRLVELYDDARKGRGGAARLGVAAPEHRDRLGLMSDSWAGAEFWEAQRDRGGLTLEQLIERCEVATIGIDGGGLDDLLGLYVIGRERDTGAGSPGQGLGAPRSCSSAGRRSRRSCSTSRPPASSPRGEPGEDIEELADIVEQVYAAGCSIARRERQMRRSRRSAWTRSASAPSSTRSSRGVPRDDHRHLAGLEDDGRHQDGRAPGRRRRLCTAASGSWPGASATRRSSRAATRS
jgi:hypothetical protein